MKAGDTVRSPLHTCTLLRALGRGSFGLVFVARDEAGRERALELALPGGEEDLRNELRHDRELQASFGSSYVRAALPVLDAGEVLEGGQARPWYTRALYEGSLKGFGGDLPERLRAARGALRAGDWLGQMGVVHRDFKPDNLLRRGVGPDLDVRAVDFGIARPGGYVGRQFVGTPGYMPNDPAPDPLAQDRFALAVVSFELLVGSLPRACQGAAQAWQEGRDPRASAMGLAEPDRAALARALVPLDPALADPLADALHTCLGPAPGRRVGELLDAVNAACAAPRVDEHPPETREDREQRLHRRAALVQAVSARQETLRNRLGVMEGELRAARAAQEAAATELGQLRRVAEGARRVVAVRAGAAALGLVLVGALGLAAGLSLARSTWPAPAPCAWPCVAPAPSAAPPFPAWTSSGRVGQPDLEFGAQEVTRGEWTEGMGTCPWETGPTCTGAEPDRPASSSPLARSSKPR